MAAKAPTVSYDAILREVGAGNFRPVYYLMGEESYYIDKIADFLIEKSLKEEEKAFNLVTVFGLETTIETVMDTARSYAILYELTKLRLTKLTKRTRFISRPSSCFR